MITALISCGEKRRHLSVKPQLQQYVLANCWVIIYLIVFRNLHKLKTNTLNLRSEFITAISHNFLAYSLQNTDIISAASRRPLSSVTNKITAPALQACYVSEEIWHPYVGDYRLLFNCKLQLQLNINTLQQLNILSHKQTKYCWKLTR